MDAHGVFIWAHTWAPQCGLQIASRHIRVPHTSCPLHAYAEAKSKGRLRDLPLGCALPVVPASAGAGAGTSVCHQSAPPPVRQAESLGDTPKAQNSFPLSPTFGNNGLGSDANARHAPEGGGVLDLGAWRALQLPANSDTSYQGTFDSLEKSVRGG